MKRLTLILILFITACSPLETNTPESSPTAGFNEMNLLVISLDTLRQDRVGAYGCPVPVSPFMDRFSHQAQLFTDVSSQSSNTIASHRALFTSKYPYTFHKGAINPDISLAGKMRAGGWETAAFVDGGKMHRSFGNHSGFTRYDDAGGGFNAVLPKARAWLQTTDRGKFFLFLHTYDIHSPYAPPYPYSKLLTSFETPRLDLAGKHPPFLTSLDLSKDDLRYISDQYDGSVRACDADLMAFFDFLREENLLDNTIVVILSDHGESLGERDLIGHRRLYNVQLKVPLMIRIPGHRTRMVSGPVENIDLMPTLLTLFGQDLTAPSQGMDLSPFFMTPGSRISSDRLHLSETTNKAVQSTDGWKYILREVPEDDEMYFLETDPEELTNLTDRDPHRAEQLKERFRTMTGRALETLRIPHKEAHSIKLINSEESKLKQQLEVLGYLDSN